jgi:hypothetical protein
LPCAQRRGVLLLVVLSMLTLFLMLGVAYLVTATRARETARAYARLVTGGDDARVPHAQLLDRIMLKTLRGGGQAPTAPGAALPSGGIVFESLLADKYGYNTSSATVGTISATASGVSISGPIVICSITGTASLAPTDLNGRVLTFVQPGRAATSHRIIRAQATSGTTNAPTTSFALALDKPFQTGPFTIPTAGRVIINGREFAGDKASNPLTDNSNEAWDGFDDHNRFLAQVTGTNTSSSLVTRGTYISGSNAVALTGTTDYDGDLIPDDADNDNDGVNDGVFLDFSIPDASDANGGPVQLRASVLIVDLDSRYNVNAHDSLSRIVNSTTSNYFPSTKVINAWGLATNLPSFMPNPSGVPVGSGYGPAEISGGQNKIFTGTATYQPTEDPATFTLAGGSTAREVGKRPTGSRYSIYSSGSSLNPTPQLDSLEGRYGSEKRYDVTRTDISKTPWTGLARSLTYGSTATTSTTAFFQFARPGQALVDDAASQLTDRRTAATAGTSYGIPPQWWAAETNYSIVATFPQTLDWSTAYSSAPTTPRGVFNSPPDLHGRMKTSTKTTGTAPVPQLVFAKPEWGSDTLNDLETRDDPYETCLDTRDGRGGLLHDPATNGTGAATIVTLTAVDNLYSPAEIEPVLRPYDRDTNILPPRLVTMLGSAAEEARFKVTTDSWDSTAIAGGDATSGAAAKVFNWLSGSATSGSLYGATPLDGIIGGEIAKGERFDLNRALLESGTANSGTYTPTVSTNLYYRQRQAYFKDLYTLLVALNPGADRGTLAQWAANAVEFRDADSVMTPFEYDTNPANGWSPDGDMQTSETERAVVFGTERPEILIQEAFAWRNTASGTAGMAITLHRPWNAKAISPGWYSATTVAGVPAGIIDAEPCDISLDTRVSGTSGRPLNQIDLGKKAGPNVSNSTNAAYNDVSGTTYPIWRLRIVDSTGSTTLQTVRFDTDTAGANEVVDSSVKTTKTGDSKAKLAADSTLTLLSGTTITTGIPATPTAGTATISVTGSTRTFSGLSLPGTATSGTVLLERLSIPSIALTSSNAAQSAIWNSVALSATGTSPAVWVTVDSCSVTVTETQTVLSPAAFSATSTARTPGSLFWKPSTASPTLTGATVTIPSTVATSGATAWFPWPNRPFVSSAELMLVPRGTPLEMLQNYSALPAAVASYGIPVTPLDLLFDTVHVPTRFSKIHTTTTVNTSANTGIDTNFTTVNQLSSFREPGRVNLNTVMSDEVWNAVVLGPLTGSTGMSGSTGLPTRTEAQFSGTSPAPAKSLVKMLSLMSTGSQPVNDKNQPDVLPTTLNPLHSLYTATRLANTVTPRSNVFAVWITLRESVKNDPDSVKYHRAFYIIDRSIPVGFEDGADYNVLNCVRLRRIIE